MAKLLSTQEEKISATELHNHMFYVSVFMYSLHKTELLLCTEFLLIGKKACINVLKSFILKDIQQDI